MEIHASLGHGFPFYQSLFLSAKSLFTMRIFIFVTIAVHDHSDLSGFDSKLSAKCE